MNRWLKERVREIAKFTSCHYLIEIEFCVLFLLADLLLSPSLYRARNKLSFPWAAELNTVACFIKIHHWRNGQDSEFLPYVSVWLKINIHPGNSLRKQGEALWIITIREVSILHRLSTSKNVLRCKKIPQMMCNPCREVWSVLFKAITIFIAM